MNIRELIDSGKIELQAGGPGSGRHPGEHNDKNESKVSPASMKVRNAAEDAGYIHHTTDKDASVLSKNGKELFIDHKGGTWSHYKTEDESTRKDGKGEKALLNHLYPKKK